MKLTKLKDIVVDAGTQIRVALDDNVVDEYCEAYKQKKELPSLDVFVSGKRRILADGFHRYAGAKRAELTELPCILHEGSNVDALRFALGANATHGLKRTNADKNNAIKIAFKTFPELSNRAVAEMCAVSSRFADNHRPNDAPEPAPVEPEPSPAPGPKSSTPPPRKPTPAPPPKRIGRDGKARAVPEPKKRVDKTGYVIPGPVLALWDDAEELRGQIQQIVALKGIIKLAEEKKLSIFAEVNFQTIRASLEQAQCDWERAIPYAVCPVCQGQPAIIGSCNGCYERGFVSEFFWKNCVPEDVRKLREGEAK